ncbi:TPA: P27 family phage terminase small subunit [Staphylococcus aureus]|uniref:P27 family phage terminase small subunit n=1 Tax=Staphylococcus aureus TaxID=1280 RepID=UPI000F42AE5E|nr:P27 family phage terminase small subunit [Staphylococcus aureus]RNH93537.1 terminase [Staphylococcus aureus]HCD5889879.1 P27 family phage terminase small subunit [Staphylococcus aureus]
MDKQEIKNYLKSKVADTPINNEKIERYINLLNIFYNLDKSIEENGVMLVTINATQEFTKVNPAIAEKNKINTQLLNIEKSFDLNVPILVDLKPRGLLD